MMNPLLVALAPYVGALAGLAVLYAVVSVLISSVGQRRKNAERDAQHDRDYWRTVKADPRKSKRGNWRPPSGGFAA